MGMLDRMVFPIMMLAFAVSLLVAFQSWFDSRKTQYVSSAHETEIKIEITRQSPETDRWIGSALDRCLSSSDCRFEHDGNRIVFRGIDATAFASDVPDGIRITQIERPIAMSIGKASNPFDEFLFEWVKFGLPLMLAFGALIIVLLRD